jgi:hypothetical protein
MASTVLTAGRAATAAAGLREACGLLRFCLCCLSRAAAALLTTSATPVMLMGSHAAAAAPCGPRSLASAWPCGRGWLLLLLLLLALGALDLQAMRSTARLRKGPWLRRVRGVVGYTHGASALWMKGVAGVLMGLMNKHTARA